MLHAPDSMHAFKWSKSVKKRMCQCRFDFVAELKNAVPADYSRHNVHVSKVWVYCMSFLLKFGMLLKCDLLLN